MSGDGYGFGASATEIGFILLPGAVVATLAGPARRVRGAAFRLACRGRRRVVIMATAMLALAVVHTEVWHLVVGKALIALANGLCVTAMVTSIAIVRR